MLNILTDENAFSYIACNACGSNCYSLYIVSLKDEIQVYISKSVVVNDYVRL